MLKVVTTENASLKTQLSEIKGQLEELKSHESRVSLAKDKHVTLGHQLQQLLTVHNELGNILQ